MALTIAIIGAGKVGTALARALADAGYEIGAVSSRGGVNAVRLAEELGVQAFVDPVEAAKSCTAVLICTPDGTIAEVAARLAGKIGPRIALHMAGSLGKSTLKVLQEKGWETGCLHPLQTFAGNDPISVWQNVFFAVDGSKQALALAMRLAHDLGGRPIEIGEKDRPLYHAAACAVSNYLTVLVQWAVRRYAKIGFTSDEAVKALLPLLQGTLDNLERVGAEAALTGPISRGDAATVGAHLAVVPEGWETEIYRSLGRGALESAFAQNRIDASAYQRITQLLAANKGEEK